MAGDQSQVGLEDLGDVFQETSLRILREKSEFTLHSQECPAQHENSCFFHGTLWILAVSHHTGGQLCFRSSG